MSHDSMVSKLKFDLEKITKDFKAINEKNAFLVKILKPRTRASKIVKGM